MSNEQPPLVFATRNLNGSFNISLPGVRATVDFPDYFRRRVYYLDGPAVHLLTYVVRLPQIDQKPDFFLVCPRHAFH